MPRNKPWTREECILALELFVRGGRKQIDKRRQEVVEVSRCLQALPAYPASERDEKFRNPSSVALKLGNFCALDPDCPGQGRPNGSAMDAAVWDEFRDNESALFEEAAVIRRQCATPGVDCTGDR